MNPRFTSNIGANTANYNYFDCIQPYLDLVKNSGYRQDNDIQIDEIGIPTYEDLEIAFHSRMQNPLPGINLVDLSHPSQTLKSFRLESKMIDMIGNYFRLNKGDNGNYLLGSIIDTVDMSGNNLSTNLDRMGHVIEPMSLAVARLIENNPSIASLDLSDTNLTDRDGLAINLALEKNTKLLQIDTKGNHLSKEIINRMNELLERNIKINPKNDNLYSSFTIHIS